MATIKLLGLNAGMTSLSGDTDTLVTDGSVTFGNADTDTIIVNAEFDSDLVPDDSATYALGSTDKVWSQVYAQRMEVIGNDETTEIKITGTDSYLSGTTSLVLTGIRGSTTTPASQIKMDIGITGNAGALIATFSGETNSKTSGADLAFFTAPDYVEVAERLRITKNGNVGIGTTAPTCTLSVAGSQAANVLGINSSNDPGTTYTVAVTDHIILVNTRPANEGGIDSAIAITLPDASAYAGRLLIIKDAAGYSDINNITLNVIDGDNFEGDPNFDTLVLDNPAAFKRLVSDGVLSWYEIGGSSPPPP